MGFAVRAWPDEGHPIVLDHHHFAYAGTFRMGRTGKVVAETEGDIVGAVSFSPDRTDPETAWIRYVTVHRDHQGKGVGPRLLAYTREALLEAGYQAVNIGVNNPYAFVAAVKAGFAVTGEETGLEAIALRHPGDRSEEGFREGLAYFEANVASEELRAYARDRASSGVPEPIEVPEGSASPLPTDDHEQD